MSSEQNQKFHVSLKVANLGRSVEFYGRLFGLPPSKFFADYAKFDVEDPGLVLSLEQCTADEKPSLSHLGVKLTDRNRLIAMASKVAERGLEFQHLDNVACCYADQSKIFMNDPDGILFEVYNVNKDIAPEAATTAPTTLDSSAESDTKSFDHTLPGNFPTTLPNPLEKIALRGTLNASLTNDQYFEILKSCFLALSAGGEILLHMLVADRETAETLPTLPEPASHVRRIPSETLVWDLLREAGFVGLTANRLSSHHVFSFGGSHFRELLIKGSKPIVASNSQVTCVYKGPFPKIELENGQTFLRGQRQDVAKESLALIQSSLYRESFVFLNEASACATKS